ncbi:bifunctional diaminohydroxyphosphoribosylaminopyrimidine deaminase/5-amino-6-(5-phosphoribosylamino)uracil reductase RibD [Candidatus Bipolaricaulota bacterium]
MSDARWMHLALEQAGRGLGRVNPNPIVGAVVVRDGEVVGQGAHLEFGGPHAEVNALDEAGEAARGATLYVTLEPCCHHGKTPPCTQRIIQAGIRRVVVAARDPNSLINGKGICALRDASIEVVEGVMQQEALHQNEIFFTFIIKQRPFVHLKLAMSIDGRIATKTGDSKWISSEESRVRAHDMRRKYATILVGVGTVVSDDPSLSVRHVSGPDPRPIVLDPTGRIPLTSRLLTGAQSPILATHSMSDEKERQVMASGAIVWRLPLENQSLDLQELLDRLFTADLDSVLIEGGGTTAATFLAAGLVDKISVFIAPLIIGGVDAVPGVGGQGAERIVDALRLHRVTTEWCGPDLLYTGYTAE